MSDSRFGAYSTRVSGITVKYMKINMTLQVIFSIQLWRQQYHHWIQPRPRHSSFIYIFLIFNAFSHEKTGTRWFGGGAEDEHKPDASEKIEGLVDFPTTRTKLPWNCPGCEMPNYCVLKHNYLQLKGHRQWIFLLPCFVLYNCLSRDMYFICDENISICSKERMNLF
jgi:hypothetical protein